MRAGGGGLRHRPNALRRPMISISAVFSSCGVGSASASAGSGPTSKNGTCSSSRFGRCPLSLLVRASSGVIEDSLADACRKWYRRKVRCRKGSLQVCYGRTRCCLATVLRICSYDYQARADSERRFLPWWRLMPQHIWKLHKSCVDRHICTQR